MTTKLISMRLDRALIEQIDQFADLKGKTRTDVLDLLLREALVRRGAPVGIAAPQIRKPDQLDGFTIDGVTRKPADAS